ncbi:histidine phosphatase family protein [Neobacillus notoginsengisoli]|uniref:Histidine phosphatase family protein n=1 Tax=Neobacillus notoginsengisoli TaxID=1578198 RepID=A0A417YVQ9_9BACI|nr:histidine phosphatase family protein [Neobacillus notoginsengisoli]RHW41480.1 histidine phosphatase family protein [Neobacillus notoginsengisoli]
MATFGFIRHGSTAWNKERRAQGSSNIPLDQDGINEARLVAERLSGESWDVIYASPQLRAKQTAEIIAITLGVDEIHFDPRLREINGGQIEGTTESERIVRWGNNWRELDLGIEQHESVVERGLAAVRDISDANPDKNILIVSHGVFIRKIISELAPALSEEAALLNTAVTVLEENGEVWECSLYNCTKHLRK